MTRHVVFGTGQVGRLVVEQLVALGHDVVAVNRSGRGRPPRRRAHRRRRHRPGLHHPGRRRRRRRLLLPQRHQLRPVGRGVPAAATRRAHRRRGRRCPPRRARQPLRLRPDRRPGPRRDPPGAADLDQGRDPGRDDRPSSSHAHHAGRVEVAIGRASDYFGPGTTQSALGETVFGTALTGRTAQVMGNPDQPHSYSYTPDVAAALITLGTQPGATGAVWHLPVAETRTHPTDHRPRLPARRSPAPQLRRRPHHACA